MPGLFIFVPRSHHSASFMMDEQRHYPRSHLKPPCGSGGMMEADAPTRGEGSGRPTVFCTCGVQLDVVLSEGPVAGWKTSLAW